MDFIGYIWIRVFPEGLVNLYLLIVLPLVYYGQSRNACNEIGVQLKSSVVTLPKWSRFQPTMMPDKLAVCFYFRSTVTWLQMEGDLRWLVNWTVLSHGMLRPKTQQLIRLVKLSGLAISVTFQFLILEYKCRQQKIWPNQMLTGNKSYILSIVKYLR